MKAVALKLVAEPNAYLINQLVNTAIGIYILFVIVLVQENEKQNISEYKRGTKTTVLSKSGRAWSQGRLRTSDVLSLWRRCPHEWTNLFKNCWSSSVGQCIVPEDYVIAVKRRLNLLGND